MWVTTAEDSSPAQGGKATIVVYGDKGKSDEIELFAPSSTARLFEPANSDEFEVGQNFLIFHYLDFKEKIYLNNNLALV